MKTVKNGVFFTAQTAESLTQAITTFEEEEAYFLENRAEISKNMQKFSRENFEKNMKTIVQKFMEEQE